MPVEVIVEVAVGVADDHPAVDALVPVPAAVGPEVGALGLRQGHLEEGRIVTVVEHRAAGPVGLEIREEETYQSKAVKV